MNERVEENWMDERERGVRCDGGGRTTSYLGCTPIKCIEGYFLFSPLSII